MMRLLTVGPVLGLVALALPARAEGLDADAKKELKRLEGNWRCTRQERDGSPVAAAVAKGDGLVIEGDEVQTLWSGNNRGGVCKITKVDPKTNAIDIEWTKGSLRGKKQLGFYKLTATTFEVCWAAPDSKKRPRRLSSKPGVGNGHHVLAYKREKEE